MFIIDPCPLIITLLQDIKEGCRRRPFMLLLVWLCVVIASVIPWGASLCTRLVKPGNTCRLFHRWFSNHCVLPYIMPDLLFRWCVGVHNTTPAFLYILRRCRFQLNLGSSITFRYLTSPDSWVSVPLAWFSWRMLLWLILMALCLALPPRSLKWSSCVGYI